MSTVRAVIGVPLYNGERHLEGALTSLLSQTLGDFAVVLVDDASTDATAQIARRFAEADPRVTFRQNPARLGMVGNWRETFEQARRLHPDAEYFAWGSDHDLWAPDWLRLLVADLDAHPEAVLAWCDYEKIRENGEVAPSKNRRFDSAGMPATLERLEHVVTGMLAGNMIYGLMRADAVERAGGFPAVLLPDRLLLARMAIIGEFRQIPERAWQRRVMDGQRVTLARQRRSLFLRPPLSSRLPWWVVHVAGFRDWLAEAGPEHGLASDGSQREAVATFRRTTRRVYREAQRRKRIKWRRRLYVRVAGRLGIDTTPPAA